METTKLKRPENWPSLLDAFMRSRSGVQFQWGSHDCALFAADAVLAMTGVDLAVQWRGRYDSAEGAAEVLGAGGLAAVVASTGLEEIAPKMAQRGDVLLLDADYGETLAICQGRYMASPSAVGFGLRRVGLAKRAWRVG